MATPLPEVASLEDVSAIKAEIESLDEETLNARNQALLQVVNTHRVEHDRLERQFLEAEAKVSRARLSDVLHSSGGTDIATAEQLAKEARLALRQHGVDYERAQLLLRLVGERQQWLVGNRRYKAIRYITPMWKAEQEKATEELR